MRQQVKKAEAATKQGVKKVDAASVTQSIEKVFKEQVKPAWTDWEKDVKMSSRGSRFSLL